MTRRFSLLALWLLACSHSSKSIVSVQQSEKTDTAATQHEVMTQSVQTGPETTTTVIEEFAAPVGVVGQPPQSLSGKNGEGRPDMDPALSRSAALTAPSRAQTSPMAPVLVKRTTITDIRGPTSTNTSLNAQASTETHSASSTNSKASSSSKSSLLSSPWLWLGLGCGVVLAILLAIRFKVWRAAL